MSNENKSNLDAVVVDDLRRKGLVLKEVTFEEEWSIYTFKPEDETYQRSDTGWSSLWGRKVIISKHTDGKTITTTGALGPSERPENERERCGKYTWEGKSHWGDHRVAFPGTTCVEVDCHVKHAMAVMPGSAEPMEGFYEREGVKAIAASLWNWNNGGTLPHSLGDSDAWNAAHVVLDALRDAGYTLTKE